jgi:hypothetical protein
MDPTSKPSDWQDLLRIAQGSPHLIERVGIAEKGIAVEGQSTLPTLPASVRKTRFSSSPSSALTAPSRRWIKARLNRISGQLHFVETDPSPSGAEILGRLKAGEITAEEVIHTLESLKLEFLK